jgi:hypothetical protein
MAIGPSGWTRTTTSRVKSPACCVDTTEGSGANDGIRTRTSRLGRPVGDRYPTFALEDGPVLLTGPSTSFQFSKTPLMTSWWAARDSNPSAPLGENGFTARQRTIRPYRPYGDSARIRTRTHELWRLGCFCYTTLPTSPYAANVSKTQPPSDLARTSSGRVAKTKKAF